MKDSEYIEFLKKSIEEWKSLFEKQLAITKRYEDLIEEIKNIK